MSEKGVWLSGDGRDFVGTGHGFSATCYAKSKTELCQIFGTQLWCKLSQQIVGLKKLDKCIDAPDLSNSMNHCDKFGAFLDYLS